MDPLKIWIIDDEESPRELVKSHCNAICTDLSIAYEVKEFGNLGNFQEKIASGNTPDIIIQDLKLGGSGDDRSGWEIVRGVLENKIIPVVVYSAFSGEDPAEIFKNLLIYRVKKGDETLHPVLEKFLKMTSDFKKANSNIKKEFEKLSLETIGKLFGVTNGDLEKIPDNLIVQLAITRLVSYLMNSPINSEKFLSESIFIYPNIERIYLLAGDFIQKSEDKSIWFVSSPSCDLVISDGREAKVEKVLLLRCYTKHADVPFLKGVDLNGRKSRIKDPNRKNTIKILKCPAAIFESNHILISFKEYETLSYKEIIKKMEEGKLKILSSLATPYGEDLKNFFIRDFSRMGAPETNDEKEEVWGTKFCSD
ncbi:hypothetical protein METP3_01236 [Methanosarcinales archaeon]|nr:MAG: response regulator [Candidatus Methanoperedens sp.]CAG0967532.1 hypothetical protein METP3_01236 [Methanosarcinales archaeon]